MQPNSDQKLAIEYDLKQNLLVSAAAGSGKTAVLTERIITRLLQGKFEPEEVLVMTFTEKAASNMKTKIEQKLLAGLTNADSATRARLLEIRQKFPLMQISTIHSFCLNLIRENLSELKDREGNLLLEPGFTVMDHTDQQLFLTEQTDQVMDSLYRQLGLWEQGERGLGWDERLGNQIEGEIRPFCLAGLACNRDVSLADWLRDFKRLSLTFDFGQNDQRLREKLVETRNFLRSIPDFDTFIVDKLRSWEEASQDFARSEACSFFLNRFTQSLGSAIKTFTELIHHPYYAELVKNAGKAKASKESVNFMEAWPQQLSILQELDRGLTGDQQSDWDLVCTLAKQLPRPVALIRGKEEKNDFMMEFGQGVFPCLKLLQADFTPTSLDRYRLAAIPSVFVRTVAEVERDMAGMTPVISRFFECCLLIDRAYQAVKLDRNQVDFNDFEQYSYQLVKQPAIVQDLQARIKEIYLDEYQDTNNIQEEIIKRISKSNIFMVGDLKQSIYRFRHANPGLFLGKLSDYLPYPGTGAEEAPGRVILLNQNFRSSQPVITSVNSLFRFFLREEIGEIDYDDRQALKQADQNKTKPDPITPATEVRVIVLDRKELADRQSQAASLLGQEFANGYELEAVWAVDEIRKLRRQGVPYRDICILADVHSICHHYLRVLEFFNIPAVHAGSRSYFLSRELRLLYALFSLLDNFCQDIPLASLMRSDLLGPAFEEADLLQIALSSKAEYFYQKVLALAGVDLDQAAEVDRLEANPCTPELQQRVKAFVEKVNDWRRRASWLSLSELLEDILMEDDYPAYLAGLDHADQRIKDLELFQDWVLQYDQEKGGSLHSFVNYLDNFQAGELAMENFSSPPPAAEAVSIMTIHASKGLEFPYVILAGQGKQIQSPAGEVLTVSYEGGITSMVVDPDQAYRFQTPVDYLHKGDIAFKDLAEGFRLLYVAMTRAETKLLVMGHEVVSKSSSKNKEDLLDRMTTCSRLPREAMGEIRSFLDLFEAYGVSQNSRLLSSLVTGHETTGETYYDQVETEDLLFSVQNTPAILDLATDLDLDQAKGQASAQSARLVDPDANAWTSTVRLTDLDSQDLARLVEDLDRSDPLLFAPAKLTVSELKRQVPAIELTREEDLGQEINIVQDMGFSLREPETEDQASLYGPAYGTLLHKLVQFIDLSRLREATDYPVYLAHLQEMRAAGQLSAEEFDRAAELDSWDLIAGWVRSDLAGRVLQAEQTFKELPFTLALDLGQSSILPVTPTEKAKLAGEISLVQGIIDLWFLEEDPERGEGVILVDYKSDRLGGGNLEVRQELLNRYKEQLAYYRLALEKILQKPVRDCVIWLFRRNEAFSFSPEDLGQA